MGWNLFSSLDIKDNSKVAYLEKKSNNPNICLVIGSGFSELSILWNCTTVLGTGCVRNLSWGLWACLSVNLALTRAVLSWDMSVKFLLQTALAPCALLSVVLILFFLLLLLSEAAASRKLMIQSVILITRYKSGTINFWGIFFQKMPLSNYLWCPMMNQKISSIFTFTYQE